MRLLLATLAAAGTVPASTPPRPPVIHEVFTLLPCPKHPVSTLGIEGCTEHAIVATDRKIDAQAKQIFRLLRLRAARADFVEGERAWLAYRTASCAAESSKYAGGTAAALVAASCAADRSAAHLAELVGMRKTLATP